MSFTSIRAKITMIFAVSIVLLVVLSYILFLTHIKLERQSMFAQEMASIRFTFEYYLRTNTIDFSFLESQNFRLIEDKDEKREIINSLSKKEKDKGFSIFKHHQRRFVFIKSYRTMFIFESMNQPKAPKNVIIISLSILLFLLILYIMIIRSLRPLRKLKDQIKTFSQGNLDIDCRSDKKDEIAQVANEFHSAVEKIKELKHSRQLLLRAIMHELKTPIGKGRLVSEMIDNDKQKQRLHSIFERLNLLIDEFAKIEKIESKSFELTFKSYKMSDILDASIDMLMFENHAKHINLSIKHDYIVDCDFELLALAIKNLIDNGIKYSPDKQVTIVVDNGVQISNSGNALEEDLEEYFVPFRTKSNGLGLGFYIIKNILDLHRLTFEYLHKDGQNTFTIKS
ncbi:MAG: HAMP domain-containing histidine kinase [Campylobacterales bacterium]|nr:HAMP domain-containing histidine kinase [Campylobacterales bacterium]